MDMALLLYADLLLRGYDTSLRIDQPGGRRPRHGKAVGSEAQRMEHMAAEF